MSLIVDNDDRYLRRSFKKSSIICTISSKSMSTHTSIAICVYCTCIIQSVYNTIVYPGGVYRKLLKSNYGSQNTNNAGEYRRVLGVPTVNPSNVRYLVVRVKYEIIKESVLANRCVPMEAVDNGDGGGGFQVGDLCGVEDREG